MDLTFLSFLSSPVFVIPWYAAGLIGAGWIIHDETSTNVHVMPALKIGWPIIAVFFSVLGFAAYLLCCRPPGIACTPAVAAASRHRDYVAARWKRVMGAVVYCVGGNGLGIVAAMSLARRWGLSFWAEFWFEYAAGFVFGWLVFQYMALRTMDVRPVEALIAGARAEFFSMITIMLGMGLVMRLVTPEVVGYRPQPDEAAFWGFGALGLLVGAVFTYPMNWWLVAKDWKQGMG